MNSIYLYPWDALDVGVPVLLDQLAGAGIGGVKVSLVYHTGKLLLAANPRRRVFIPDDGALNFRPSATFTGDSPVCPPVSRICEASDPLEELLREAGRRDMSVDAWIVCLHNRAIASVRPDLCTVNAFGDVYPHSLCPRRRDVRSYLTALTRELAQRGLRRVVLEAIGYVPYRHYSYCQVEGADVGPRENLMLSLCFCDACRGSLPEIEVIRHFVRTHLECFFQTGRPAAQTEIDFVLDPLLKARTDTVTSLVHQLSGTASKLGSCISVIAPCGPQDPLSGVDLKKIATALDLMYYKADASDLKQALETIQAETPPSCGIDLLLRPGFPDTRSEADLEVKLDTAAAAGVRDFSFYNYGLMSGAAFTRLKNVLARRR